MSRLAVIPARGGSKRIPRKNIRKFCGKPMIQHILETARDSELFDIIHVSTEDEEVSQLVTELGFRPEFGRPTHLADDETPLMPVLKSVQETFAKRGKTFDEIWLLMACAPLISIEDLSGCATLLKKHKTRNPVLAVTEYPVPIEWAYKLTDNGQLQPLTPGAFATPSAALKPRYHDTGTFAAFPAACLTQRDGAGRDDDFLGYILPRHRGIDIDTWDDWELAEAVFQALEDVESK